MLRPTTSRMHFLTAMVALSAACGPHGVQIDPSTSIVREPRPTATRIVLGEVQVANAALELFREFALPTFYSGIEDGTAMSGVAQSVTLEREVVVRPQDAGTWLVRLEIRRLEGSRHMWDRLDGIVRVRFYDVTGVEPRAIANMEPGQWSTSFDVAAAEPNHLVDVPIHLVATAGSRASNIEWEAYERRIGIELANQIVTGIVGGLAEAVRNSNSANDTGP